MYSLPLWRLPRDECAAHVLIFSILLLVGVTVCSFRLAGARSNILAIEADLLRQRFNLQATSLAVLAQSATPVAQTDDENTVLDKT